MSIDAGRAWVVLGGSVVGLFFSGLQRYFVGVMHAELLEKYQASNTATAWVGALYMSLMDLGGPLASGVIGRFGCRVCCVVGSLVCFSGFAASAFTTSITQLFFTYGLVAGIGLTLTYSPSVVCVSYHFNKLLPLASGLASGAAAVGMLSGPLLIQTLINEFRVLGGFLLLAAISLHHCVSGLMLGPRADELSSQRRISADVSQASGGRGQDPGLVHSPLLGEDDAKGDNEGPAAGEEGAATLRNGCSQEDAGCARVTLQSQEAVNEATGGRSSEHRREDGGTLDTVTEGRETGSTNQRQHAGADNDDSITDMETPHSATESEKTKTGFIREENSSEKPGQPVSETKAAMPDPESCSPQSFRRGHSGTFSSRLSKLKDSYLVLLSNKAFLFHGASLFLGHIHQTGAFLHLPEYVQTLGTSPTMAAKLFLAGGLGSLVSRVASGVLTTDSTIDPLIVSSGMCGLAGVATVLLPLYSASYAGQMVFTLLAGLYTGGLAALLNVLTKRFVGMTHLHTGFGLSICVCGVGSIVGPLVAALVVDYGGSYEHSYVILGSIMLMSSVCELLAGVIFLRQSADADDDKGAD